ncbi:hypothetical protein [Streptomyces sp. NPDC101150]|uniref:hypothetical protein n=1 Tax=Streptomyces sp. NPDC101150 TaxID=3366114 RepID=UPI0038157969
MWAKAKPTMDAPCVGVLPVDLYAGAVPQPAAGTMWSIRKIEFDEYDKFGR